MGNSAQINFSQLTGEQPQQAPSPTAPTPADTSHAQHGFWNALKTVALGAMPGVAHAVQTQHENQRQQEEDLRARQAKDYEFAQHMIDSGALPSFHGAVKRDLQLNDGTVIPGGFVDKAGRDGRQVIRHKTAEGETQEYELPTVDESIANNAKRLAAQFKATYPTAVMQGDLAARNKGQEKFYETQGQNQAGPQFTPAGEPVAAASAPSFAPSSTPMLPSRQPLPPLISPVLNSGTANSTPAPPVTMGAGQFKDYQAGKASAGKAANETQTLRESKLKDYGAGLQGVEDQPGLEALNARFPELKADVPQQFSPATRDAFIRAHGVPVEKQPEYDIKKAQADAMASYAKQSPEVDAQVAEQIAPKAKYPTINNGLIALMSNARKSGLPPEAMAAILKDGADRVSSFETEIAKETDPRVRQARINDMVQAEVGKQKALMAMAPDALSNVTPRFQGPATAEYMKTSTAYIKALQAADDVQSVLDLAQKGNVAAGANAQLVGVGAINAINGIKRINSAEINQYGTAGSLIQKIQGKLEGWTEGKTIPDSVLADMRALHAELAKGAKQVAEREVQTTNGTYNSKFQLPAYEPKQSEFAPVKIGSKADFDKLKPGQRYIDADGQTYTKK